MTTSGMHDLRCTGAAGNLPNSAELGLEYSNLRRYRTITECASCSDHISVKDPAWPPYGRVQIGIHLNGSQCKIGQGDCLSCKASELQSGEQARHRDIRLRQQEYIPCDCRYSTFVLPKRMRRMTIIHSRFKTTWDDSSIDQSHYLTACVARVLFG